MESSRPRSAVGSGRRTARIMIGITGIFVVGLLALWWHLASDDPAVVVPHPVMPSPNAFDFYTAAGQGILNSKQIDDASDPKIAMTLEQKEAVVQQNAGALRSLHQGFAYPYLNPPVRSFSALFPYFASDRGIARLLALQSRVRAERGNWSGAANSALDAIRLGEDLPQGGVLIAALVGEVCEAIGQRPLWKTVEHLNAAQARAAARRLEAIMERHFPCASTMQEEKWMTLAAMQEELRSVTFRTALAKANDLTGTDLPASQRYSIAFHMLYGKKQILHDYTGMMDAIAARVRLPYATKLPPLPEPSDPVIRLIDPTFDNVQFSEVKSETMNGLLLITLALHAYRLEHGRYPNALAELAPSYLKQIPADLFALQGSYAYRNKGTKFVLYSIGPDGKDDGGTPIDDPKRATVNGPKARYRVMKESQGDIVAEINY
jgi:hypothetical protein